MILITITSIHGPYKWVTKVFVTPIFVELFPLVVGDFQGIRSKNPVERMEKKFKGVAICWVVTNTCSHSIHGTGIYTYIYHILPLKTTIHVGKYTIHGWYGVVLAIKKLGCPEKIQHT